MSDFSSKGYITLDELDGLVKRIDQLEKDLGSTSSVVSKASNMVYYKNDSATGKVSKMLNIKNAAIDAQRIRTKITDKGTINIKFGQSYTQSPIVIASADTYVDDFLVTVDSVTTNGCTLRFIKVASKSKKAAGQLEFINVIAIGKTSD